MSLIILLKESLLKFRPEKPSSMYVSTISKSSFICKFWRYANDITQFFAFFY